MAELVAPIPELPLTSGYKVRLEAISPTTGAAVSGVTVAQATLHVLDVTDDAGDGTPAGPFMLVPGPDSAIG